MNISSIVEPWSQRVGRHLEFVLLDPQKPSRLKKQMIESLQYVKSNPTKDRRFLDIRIKRFFDATFESGKLGLEFTEKERKEIGSLINETILDIDDCLLGIGEGFDIDKGPEALIVRSGFQFMIENFKDFPDGHQGTLEHIFDHLRKSESIDILDKSLARWKESPFGCEENVQHTSEILDRPKGVPVSHHWWF